MQKVPRKTERTRDIVKAAAELFALQGYNRTSTREIADLAHVSENTLFRHFDRKEDLFWLALRSRSTGLKPQQDLLDGLTRCDAPEVVFPKIIDLLLNIVTFSPDLWRLIAVAVVELHPKADAFSDEYLSPILSTVSSYLSRSIQSGKIRDLDPTMATVALVTTVLLHSELSRLMDDGKVPYADSREAAGGYTKFWLELLSLGPSVRTSQIMPMTGQMPG
jgi:AcrR family transcriptional regulator